VSIREHTWAYVSIRWCCCRLDKPWQARQRQYLYFCTSKANKLGCRFEKVCCPSTSAYASIRQHTSAYVSIRQHTSAYAAGLRSPGTQCLWRQYLYFFTIKANKMSSKLSTWCPSNTCGKPPGICCRFEKHTSAYVSIAYVSIAAVTAGWRSTRQHTSAYVSIRQHTLPIKRMCYAAWHLRFIFPHI
jgi:hypothetical protein